MKLNFKRIEVQYNKKMKNLNNNLYNKKNRKGIILQMKEMKRKFNNYSNQQSLKILILKIIGSKH